MKLNKLGKKCPIAFTCFCKSFPKHTWDLKRRNCAYIRSFKHTYRPIKGSARTIPVILWNHPAVINWVFLQFTDSWHSASFRGGGGKAFYEIKKQCFKCFGHDWRHLRYVVKCDHYMRYQLNHEMLWPTNSQKQLLNTHYHAHRHGASRLVIISSPSILAVNGLGPLEPQGHYRAFPRSVPGTDSVTLYYIWQENRN